MNAISARISTSLLQFWLSRLVLYVFETENLAQQLCFCSSQLLWVCVTLCCCEFIYARLANTPLETAYELHVVASMTQLVQLELGIIFDGSSAHHDVPRALEALGDLQHLQVCAPPSCTAYAVLLQHFDDALYGCVDTTCSEVGSVAC